MVNTSNFQSIADKIEKRLIEMDKGRDELLKMARTVTKYAGQSIEYFHNNQVDKAEDKLKQAKQLISKINERLENERTNYQIGIIGVAFQEYAEAKLFHEIIFKNYIPSVEDLKITEQAYLLGMADFIGELRRFILEKLVEGKTQEAKDYYEIMKELYMTFLQLEYGKNLVHDFRRKRDTARVLVERTLSDLFVALQSRSLEEKLQKRNLDD